MVRPSATVGGPSGGPRSAGRSTIWDAQGGVILELPAEGAWVQALSLPPTE